MREELKADNFVVKRLAAQFNQVYPDQGQEWLNATGNISGGIVGINKKSSTLTKWSLSYNLKSQLTGQTIHMFGVSHDYSLFHKESYKGRIAADIRDEKALTQTLERFNVLSDETQSEMLQNPVTKDLATDTVQESLLRAQQLRQHQLKNTFVEK